MTTTSRSTRRSRPHRPANASQVIRQSLQDAALRLHEAGHGNLSPKSLHDLRVACRRAEAALRLSQDVADSRAWAWLKRHLKILRHTCNQARDDDVLAKWIHRHGTSSDKSLRRAVQAHRQKLQPQIVKLAGRLSRNHRFERHAEKVIKQLRGEERSGQIIPLFGRRLFDEVHRFVQALPSSREDGPALHRLRIVGKRLRYASELIGEIWPDVDLRELGEHLHLLQDQLGAIHDRIVQERRLRKQFPQGSRRSAQRLAQKARHAAVRLQRQFWRWWQACPIERMLADTTAEVLTLMRTPS